METTHTQQTGDKPLGITAAAERLSVSVDTVRRWADAGTIQPSRTMGGHRRFEVEEVERVRKLMAQKRAS